MVDFSFIIIGIRNLYVHTAINVSLAFNCTYVKLKNQTCDETYNEDTEYWRITYVTVTALVNQFNATYQARTSDSCNKDCQKCGCRYTLGQQYLCWYGIRTLRMSCNQEYIYGTNMIVGGMLLALSL